MHFTYSINFDKKGGTFIPPLVAQRAFAQATFSITYCCQKSKPIYSMKLQLLEHVHELDVCKPGFLVDILFRLSQLLLPKSQPGHVRDHFVLCRLCIPFSHGGDLLSGVN